MMKEFLRFGGLRNEASHMLGTLKFNGEAFTTPTYEGVRLLFSADISSHIDICYDYNKYAYLLKGINKFQCWFSELSYIVRRLTRIHSVQPTKISEIHEGYETFNKDILRVGLPSLVTEQRWFSVLSGHLWHKRLRESTRLKKE